MAAGSPEQILKVALQAAEGATIYADDGHTSVKEIGLLNEQWVHSFIGDAISRHLRDNYAQQKDQPYVTYESIAGWLDDYFSKRSRGPYANGLTDRTRFDLAVWRKAKGLSGLIEIKDEPVMAHYSRSRDTEKLIGALRRWPELRWGIFIFSVRATSNYPDDKKLLDHMSRKREKVFDVIRDVASDYSLRIMTGKCDPKTCRLVQWSGAIIRR